MGRQLTNNSTNVRLSIPEAWWALLADWTVGEIPAPALDDEQGALEHELFHRDERLTNS